MVTLANDSIDPEVVRGTKKDFSSTKKRAEKISILLRTNIKDDINHAIKRGLKAAAVAIEANCKKESPVDTGRLRASIGHFTKDSLLKPNPEATPDDAHYSEKWTPDEGRIEIGTNVNYAGHVHAKDPWMTRGAIKSQEEVVKLMVGSLKALNTVKPKGKLPDMPEPPQPK